MKRSRRILTILMALIMALSFTQIASAKDVSDDFDMPVQATVKKLTKGTFEKVGDYDAYSFISAGGSYTLTVYGPKEYDDGWNTDVIPMGLDYGTFDYFSAIAGEAPSYMVGDFMSYDEIFADPEGGMSGDLYKSEVIDLGKISKGTEMSIRFYGKYKGDYKFKITGKLALPKATTLKKLVKGKKSFTAKWTKATGAQGYQIVYATNSKFTKNKGVVKVKGGSTLKTTIKKLKSKKTYYVRMRSYRKVGKRCHYGPWSDTLKVKTK